MPPGGQQCARGDGVAQPRLFLPFGIGQRAPQQGHVAGGDAVGDAAEALGVIGAENGAAGDGYSHAGIEQSGRQRDVAEMRTGNRKPLHEMGRETVHRNPSRRWDFPYICIPDRVKH